MYHVFKTKHACYSDHSIVFNRTNSISLGSDTIVRQIRTDLDAEITVESSPRM